MVPVVLLLLVSVYFSVTNVPSTVRDFHPTTFAASANQKFWYSTGDNLHNGDSIDPSTPTLLRGAIGTFQVSPDETKIAVVVNGSLTIVENVHGTQHQIVPVDSIYREHKPIGKTFFRDNDFQWSRDSSTFYLIKDVFQDSAVSQLYSSRAELLRYSVATQKLDSVVAPFPAYSYFFGENGVIYYSVATSSGDLELDRFDGTKASKVSYASGRRILPTELSHDVSDRPFASYESYDYGQKIVFAKGLGFAYDESRKLQKIMIGDKAYLTLTHGEGFKGTYYCSELDKSAFLPGDRYILVNLGCKNYDGQLLIDTISSAYERLPANTRVYVTMNTETYPHYRITSGGLDVDK